MEDTTDDRIKKSLRYSILDGAFYSAMVGFGESFFPVFAVFMKASNIQIGLLDALPKSLGSLSQLLSNRFVRLFNSRKKFVATSALLEGLMYMPIILTFFLGKFRLVHLILFVSIYWILGMILNPAWSSWMGDLVPESQRGSYFGRRNRIAGLTSFVAFLSAGFLLQRFSYGTLTQYLGFVIIFALAMLSRIMSFIALTKKFEPEYHFEEKAQFSFMDFLRQARFRNYGLFALYLSFMNFCVYLAAPYFTVYMISDLGFSYLTFTFVSAASILVKYLSMPVWGMTADRFGTRKIMSLTGFLMPMVPILWLFSANFWYLILIQFFSGFIWAGFELSTFNFIFDTTTAAKRSTCVAYYNVLNGFGIVIGAVLGSLIVRYNNLFWSKYLLVFLLSGILRFAASFIFLPKLREVRPVESIPYSTLLFKITTVAPTMGIVHEISSINRNLVTINKKILSSGKTLIKKNLRRVNEKIVTNRRALAEKLRKVDSKIEQINPFNGKKL
jgi:MFS family permease